MTKDTRARPEATEDGPVEVTEPSEELTEEEKGQRLDAAEEAMADLRGDVEDRVDLELRVAKLERIVNGLVVVVQDLYDDVEEETPTKDRLVWATEDVLQRLRYVGVLLSGLPWRVEDAEESGADELDPERLTKAEMQLVTLERRITDAERTLEAYKEGSGT